MRLRVAAVSLALLSCATGACGGSVTVTQVVVPGLADGGPTDVAWSPDGSRLAFSTEAGGLYVLDLRSHVERRIGGGAEPAWAPDGKRLAWWDVDEGIYVGDAEGKERRLVAEVPEAQSAEFLKWSPEGSRLVYSVSGGLEPELVVAVDIDGGHQRVLAGGGLTATARQPSWAPDGRRIVFGGERALIVMRADGSGKHALRPRVSPLQPMWSPGGRLIAFEEIGVGISVMNARGGGLRRLSHNQLDASPSWSPDGSRIAFARYRPCGVFVVSVRGGRASKVAQHCD